MLFNKPYDVLTQFRPEPGRQVLSDFIENQQVRVAGRLDADSEGLLLLTDEGWLNAAITQPRRHIWKTYWVQVEGEPQPDQLAQLRQGILLKDGLTLPAQAELMAAPALWPRIPPIRVRRHIPDSWLCVKIHEGRNRQIRRMTAAVGLPTLRLVRAAIGPFSLEALQPGEWRERPLPEGWQPPADYEPRSMGYRGKKKW